MNIQTNNRLTELLQCFYEKVTSNNPYQHFLMKNLKKKISEVETQPLHLVQMTFKSVSQIDPHPKKAVSNYLYKGRDFPTAFLFSFLFDLVMTTSIEELHELHNQFIQKISFFYRDDKFERYRENEERKIDYIFETLEYFMERRKSGEITNLFKIFFEDLFDSFWMKKMSIEHSFYEREAWQFLKLLLSQYDQIMSSNQINDKTEICQILNCSFYFIDQKTQELMKYGENSTKEYVFYVNSFEFMVKEEDISENIDMPKQIKSSELTHLISDMQKLTKFHQKNTKNIERIFKFDDEKLGKKVLSSNDLSF